MIDVIEFTDNTRAFDVIETAQKLDVTPQTVRSYEKEGRLEGQKIKGKLYIFEESIERLIQEARNKNS